MSRTTKIRKQKAQELIEKLQRGPASFSFPEDNHEARRSYNIWVSTWIIPEILDLIPELKKREIGA